MIKKNSEHLSELEQIVRELDGIRQDPQHSRDITLAEYVQARWGESLETFYEGLGVEPHIDTIQNLVSMPDTNFRWLVPEIFRDAIRLGLRKNPIYPNLIAGEQNVPQLQITMPAIMQADAMPHSLGVAETIPLGDITFDQKTVKISKVGRGIKVSYEVLNYVALNLVGLFFQDFGVKLGMGLDYLALTTLINGDQADGSDSAPVIGIITGGTMIFKDFLRPWIRLARLGKTPTTMVAGEDMCIDLLDLFATTRVFGEQRGTLNLRTPMPSNADVYCHSVIATNKVLMVDKSSSMIKLNAQPLLMETEKIVSNQTQATYATITTGFATLFRDSRVIMDRSLAYSGNQFPAYMDPTFFESKAFPTKYK